MNLPRMEASLVQSEFSIRRVAPLVLVWIFAIGVGLLLMLRYEFAASELAEAAHMWPADSRLTRDAQRSTLLMFVHPHCPCSGASLSELDRMLARCPRIVNVQVVFWKPPAAADDWTDSKLWKRAQQIGLAQAVWDNGGEETRRFDCRASGETLLYSADGELVFRGGLTASRGHEGGSRGQEALLAYLRDGVRPQQAAPAFGCSLFPKVPPDMPSHPPVRRGS